MSKRQGIIELHNAGMSVKKIKNPLKVPISTVYDAVARYKELGNAKDCPRSGRPRSARTKENIKAVRERVRRNPKRSMRKMANQMKMDPKSMRTIIKPISSFLPSNWGSDSISLSFRKRKGRQISASNQFDEVWHAWGGNCLLRWETVHCGGAIQPSKWQNASKTIGWRFWRHFDC